MAITVSSIITQYGEYYKKGQNNRSRLFAKITQPSETLAIPGVKHIHTDETVYETANVNQSEVVQAYQHKFTPKGNTTFTPNVIPLAKLKVDQLIEPDAIEDNWLGFLAGDTQKLKDWPITRYILEQLIANKIIEDRELQMVYKGVRSTPTDNVAGAADDSMNGFKKILTDSAAAAHVYPIHKVAGIGALNINDRYRLYSDIALPGFTLIPRMVMSKFLASHYTGTTVAGSALVQDGMVSNCLLKWDDMSYMQVVSGAESPVMRHTVQDTVAGRTVSYRTPYFGVFDAGIADNVGLVADPDWYALAEACRGGDVSGTTLDETYHSELGMPRTGMHRGEFRRACDAVNTEHGVTASYRRLHAGAFHVLNELAWGARCKYLNYDIQNVAAFGEGTAAKLEQNVWEAWGGGRREPFIPNGVTAPLGDNTGYVTYKLEMVDGTETTIKCGCLFGVELPLGYLWQVCDDLLCYAVNGEMHAYLCDDPAHYFHPGGTTAESWAAAHGYALVAVMPLGGSYFIARESMSGDGLSLPMEIGGSGVGATAGTGDLYTSLVASSTGWYGPFLGGRADLGAGAGLGSMSLTLYPSKGSVNTGCRICRG